MYQDDQPTIIAGIKYTQFVPVKFDDEPCPTIELDENRTIINVPEHNFNFPHFTYADILYPASALDKLALSRTPLWDKSINIDTKLKSMLGQWLRAVKDYREYAAQLFAAIHLRKCEDGVFLRLNLECLAPPDISTTTISVRGRTITLQKPTRTTITMRDNLKRFLSEHRRYIADMNTIYDRLKTIHVSYDLEQALLGWAGFLVLRAAAKNSPDVRLHEGKLLTQAPLLDTQ